MKLLEDTGVPLYLMSNPPAEHLSIAFRKHDVNEKVSPASVICLSQMPSQHFCIFESGLTAEQTMRCAPGTCRGPHDTFQAQAAAIASPERDHTSPLPCETAVTLPACCLMQNSEQLEQAHSPVIGVIHLALKPPTAELAQKC